MVIVGRESSRVDRTLCSESLLMFKSRGVEELERGGREIRSEESRGDRREMISG